MSYYPSPDLDRRIQDIMIEELQSVKKTPGFLPNLVIQPLYEASIRASKDRGGSAAGLDADGPLTGMLAPNQSRKDPANNHSRPFDHAME